MDITPFTIDWVEAVGRSENGKLDKDLVEIGYDSPWITLADSRDDSLLAFVNAGEVLDHLFPHLGVELQADLKRSFSRFVTESFQLWCELPRPLDNEGLLLALSPSTVTERAEAAAQIDLVQLHDAAMHYCPALMLNMHGGLNRFSEVLENWRGVFQNTAKAARGLLVFLG